MSFSSEAKTALAREIPERPCCRLAMLAGMVRFAPAKDGDVLFRTEARDVADAWRGCSPEWTGISVFTHTVSGIYKTRLSIGAIREHAPQNIFRKRYQGISLSARAAGPPFSAGAFLCSGFVNPPEKPARLDLAHARRRPCLRRRRGAHEPFPPAEAFCGGAESRFCITRDAESVEYFLSYIGANKAAFDIINAQMFKEKRSEINRKANFEIATLTKTV